MPEPADLVREQTHRLPRACYCGELAVAYTARLVPGGEPIHCPRVAEPLIDALTASAVQHSCSVPIYCIMPDHVHVILQGTGGSADTWRAMVAFKQRSGFWLARRISGTRWQKDFYDHILRSEGEVRNALVYIAANPLRARLVRDPAEYPFTGSIGHEPEGSRDR
jgi:putative transposase